MAQGKKPPKAPVSGGSDFWHASWQAAGQLAADSGRLLTFNFTPTPRAGVWRLQARVCEVVDGRPVRVAVQRSVLWPNASVERLEAQAYRLALEVLADAESDGLAQQD